MVDIAVMDFGYRTFDHFKSSVVTNGYFSANLGDYAQTLAAQWLLEQMGFAGSSIRRIDRDNLAIYDGPPIAVLMCGVLRLQTFPISKKVMPILLGVHASEETISQNAEWFRASGPVGARDVATYNILRRYEIEAFISGCVTFTIEKRPLSTQANQAYFIFGSNAGEMPWSLLQHVPSDIMKVAKFVFHRLPVGSYPLSDAEKKLMFDYEKSVIKDVRDHAKLVVTSLHHAASPAIAAGIPTIICRNDNNARFSLLSEKLPIHLPENISEIDWSPSPADLTGYASCFKEELQRALVRIGIDPTSVSSR